MELLNSTPAMAIVAALLGIVVGLIARRKGRSFLLWWLYGALIFVIAFVHVLIIKRKPAPDEMTA